MENLSDIVGQNLTALRKAKGLTQQEVALKLNYSDKSISKWELGYSIPSVDILKEFADFYGVSVDFLITENSPEDAKEVVKKTYDSNRSNETIIIALAVTAVWLVAISIYLSRIIFYDPPMNLWIAFVWALPISALVAALLSRIFFGRGITSMVLLSVFVWTFVASFAVHFMWFSAHPQNIWYILVVCIPIQVILILSLHLRRNE